jgi:hypothetical protein
MLRIAHSPDEWSWPPRLRDAQTARFSDFADARLTGQPCY